MRYCIIGPTYPYRGGIAHYTTLLSKAVRQSNEVLLISFSRQYPNWLFPGKSDKDPSQQPVQTDAEYCLDPLNPLRWVKTYKKIMAWAPDIIIFQWWHPFFTPVWTFLIRSLKRSAHRAKIIVICHNVKPHETGGFLMKKLLPLALKSALGKADAYIVHSKMDGKDLETVIPKANYAVTSLPTYAELGHHASEVSFFQPPENTPLLLFCGFVRPYKGVDVLIESMHILLKRLSVHLIIAGEFWQNGEQQIQQKIDQFQLNDKITIFNQYLPDEQLTALVKMADVITLPYRSATQSAIVQMAFGHERPVITTDVGGLAEAVTHGKTGLVVPPEDPQAFAQAIETYFKDNLKAEFIENIKAENGRFSWQTLIHTINELAEEKFNKQ